MRRHKDGSVVDPSSIHILGKWTLGQGCCVPIRIVTGLDWSGDAGSYENSTRDSPYLIVGTCHIGIEDRDEMAGRLASLRRDLRIPDDHAFKYSKSAQRVRRDHLQIMAEIPVLFTVHATDKRLWSSRDLAESSGPERIRRAIVSLVDECGDDLVCGQRLLVDANRSDARFMRDLRLDIRRRQRLLGREGFAKIAPLPDSRSDGMLIQAADMIAGYAGELLVSEHSIDMELQSKVRFVGGMVGK